jgi:uncharacterized protein (DUF1778 family)
MFTAILGMFSSTHIGSSMMTLARLWIGLLTKIVPPWSTMYVQSDMLMHSSLQAPRSRRLNLRASQQQEDLMRRGAQERGESLTDFVIRSACAEAEQTLADQRRFTLNAEQWDAFVAALDRPVQLKPRLRRLFREPSVLERRQP